MEGVARVARASLDGKATLGDSMCVQNQLYHALVKGMLVLMQWSTVRPRIQGSRL